MRVFSTYCIALFALILSGINVAIAEEWGRKEFNGYSIDQNGNLSIQPDFGRWAREAHSSSDATVNARITIHMPTAERPYAFETVWQTCRFTPAKPFVDYAKKIGLTNLATAMYEFLSEKKFTPEIIVICDIKEDYELFWKKLFTEFTLKFEMTPNRWLLAYSMNQTGALFFYSTLPERLQSDPRRSYE